MVLWAGAKPLVWRFSEDGTAVALTYTEMAMPIVAGVTLTPLDLMFSFIYWDDWVYLKSDRVRGHPAHIFQFNSPAHLKSKTDHVQIAIHAGYNALMKAEFYDKNDALSKVFNVHSFKKIDEEWIIKIIDYLNKPSHDKTRFRVIKAAIGLDLPAEFFTPSWAAMPPQISHDRLKPAY